MPAVVRGVENLLADTLQQLRQRLDRLERQVSISPTVDGGAASPGRYAKTRWVALGALNETFAGLAGSPIKDSEIVSVNGIIKDPYLDYTIVGTEMFPKWTTVFGDVVIMHYSY